MKSKFAAIGCYINYFAFGMAYIMIAQNMSFLTEKFNTDNAGVSFLISAYGIGRLASLYLSGTASDKFGRKPFVVLGAIFCALFLIGIPLSPNYGTALAFAVLGGLANAFLDAGTYPTLMESFPNAAGTATVINKAFISIGSLILPFMISFFINHNIYFGWSFFVPAIVLLASAAFLFTVKFPSPQSKAEGEVTVVKFNEKPKFHIEGLALVGIGFTAPALLYLMNIWLPVYAQEVLDMPLTSSLKLLGYYNIGAFISVIAVAIALKAWLKPVHVLLGYPIISTIATLAFMNASSMPITILCAFIIGFSLAGVLQLALSVICEFFWKNKGRMTGILCTATSSASAGIPFVTGMITRFTDVSGVFAFSLIINILGILFAIIVNVRYSKLTNTSQPSVEQTA